MKSFKVLSAKVFFLCVLLTVAQAASACEIFYQFTFVNHSGQSRVVVINAPNLAWAWAIFRASNPLAFNVSEFTISSCEQY